MTVASNQEFCGVVLAGGESSRMGRDKALLLRNGRTMLEANCHLLKELGASQIIVSRNKGEGVRDIYERCGPLGGIHAAMQQAQYRNLLVLAIDMPLLSTETLKNLLNTGLQRHKAIYFENMYLPLFIANNHINKKALSQRLQAQQNLSIRAWLNDMESQCLPVEDISEFINTNTPAEWQAVNV